MNRRCSTVSKSSVSCFVIITRSIQEQQTLSQAKKGKINMTKNCLISTCSVCVCVSVCVSVTVSVCVCGVCVCVVGVPHFSVMCNKPSVSYKLNIR